MLRTSLRASLFFALVLCCSLSWAQAGANPALYQAHKGGVKLYIVGSIHAGKGDFYPLHPTVQQAFSKADTLYLEIAPEQMTPEKITKAMQSFALLSTPVPLKKRMSSQTYQKLLPQIEKYKLPAHQLMFMQNWSIIIQLTVAAINDMGLNKDFGVDQYFSEQAKKAGKPIFGLETIDEQFAAIALMEKIDSQTLYENFLDEMQHAASWLTDIEKAWRRGETSKLSALYKEYDDRQQQAELMQALLDERNLNWQRKISKLPAGKTYMLVVGDMHVHGDNNILQLLSESGFDVKRLNPAS